jgi:hypothetical protein
VHSPKGGKEKNSDDCCRNELNTPSAAADVGFMAGKQYSRGFTDSRSEGQWCRLLLVEFEYGSVGKALGDQRRVALKDASRLTVTEVESLSNRFGGSGTFMRQSPTRLASGGRENLSWRPIGRHAPSHLPAWFEHLVEHRNCYVVSLLHSVLAMSRTTIIRSKS